MLVRDGDFRAFRPLVWIARHRARGVHRDRRAGVLPGRRLRAVDRGGRRRVEARGASWRTVAVVVATAALLFPAALPLLPATTLAASPWNGLGEQQRESVGWPELVDQVAGAYESIPAAERATSVVFTSNYGEAGAIDELGAARGLPAAYSGHNGYGRLGAAAADHDRPGRRGGRGRPAGRRLRGLRRRAARSPVRCPTRSGTRRGSTSARARAVAGGLSGRSFSTYRPEGDLTGRSGTSLRFAARTPTGQRDSADPGEPLHANVRPPSCPHGRGRGPRGLRRRAAGRHECRRPRR